MPSWKQDFTRPAPRLRLSPTLLGMVIQALTFFVPNWPNNGNPNILLKNRKNRQWPSRAVQICPLNNFCTRSGPMLHIVTHETKSVNGRFPELWATSHQIASSLVSKCVASFFFQEDEVWVWVRRSCGWEHGTNCNAYSSFPQLHNLKFNVKNNLLAVKECLKWILRIYSSCLNGRNLYSAVLVITYICINALND